MSPPSNSDTTILIPNSSEYDCVWRKNILEVFTLKEGPQYSLTDKTLRTLVHSNFFSFNSFATHSLLTPYNLVLHLHQNYSITYSCHLFTANQTILESSSLFKLSIQNQDHRLLSTTISPSLISPRVCCFPHWPV